MRSLERRISSTTTRADAMSLREAVEAFAQANDLTFMPKPGRQHEGLQVYSFGSVSVVVDKSWRDQLRAKIATGGLRSAWTQLLAAHKERARAKSKTF